jgi:PIN domain nuclease of toxin-antitoxin system
MNALLDSLVSLWTNEKEPQLQNIAEELVYTGKQNVL